MHSLFGFFFFFCSVQIAERLRCELERSIQHCSVIMERHSLLMTLFDDDIHFLQQHLYFICCFHVFSLLLHVYPMFHSHESLKKSTSILDDYTILKV